MDQLDPAGEHENLHFQKNLQRNRYSMSFNFNLLSADMTVKELKLIVLEKLQIPLRDQQIYRCSSAASGDVSSDQIQFMRPDESTTLRDLGMGNEYGDHLHMVALNRGTRYLLILHFCPIFKLAERNRRAWCHRDPIT